MEPQEEFIRENKEAFDQFDAPEWEQIQPSIPAAPVKIRRLWVWYSAAATILLIAAAIAVFKPVSEIQNTPAIANQNTIRAEVPPQASNKTILTDTAYIPQKPVPKAPDYYSIIRQLKTQNPELYQNFMKDLESLEAHENDVRSQLTTDPSNIYLLEALKYVELQKSNIIQKQIQIIQSFNQHKSNEKQL